VFPILLLPCCGLHISGPLVCSIYEIITVLCMFRLRYLRAHSKDLTSSDMKKFVNSLSYPGGDSASVARCSGEFRPNFLRDAFVFDIKIYQAATSLYL